MPFFETAAGHRLYYDIQGPDTARPVVVFLNGTTQSTLYWRTSGIALREHFTVLSYDARGQGLSRLGPGTLSLEGHAADLDALLDHLDFGRVHLVGLSHGAGVALTLACQYSQRVGRLVLCSAAARHSPRARAIVRSWLQILHLGGLEAMAWAALPVVFGQRFLEANHAILNKIVKAVAHRNRPQALAAHLAAILNYPSLAVSAPAIECPCLVLSSERQDPLVDSQGARELAELCRARHLETADAGHSIPVEIPDWFNRTICDFLTADSG